MDTAEITELEKIDATRVDGVDKPANGIPILLMKAVMDGDGNTDGPTHGAFTGKHKHPHAGSDGETYGEEHSHDGDGDHGGHDHAAKSAAVLDEAAVKALVLEIIAKAASRGKVDEAPDIAGGTEVISKIASLIIAECQEIIAGNAGEIADVQKLACAAEIIWCWRTGEEAVSTGSVMPATALMQSAADEGWTYEADEVAKDSREFSAADRKKHAAEGNALPDGSYPIPDKDALRRAAILARSGHGDVAAARRLIARRARELGVPNPLDDDKAGTSKGTFAEEGTTVDTVTQETGGQIAKAVEDAVAKALAPSQERITALEAELAKVKATPIPGGPAMSAVAARPTAPDGQHWAAKAAYYREMADTVSQDPAAAEGYRQLARQADDKAKQPAA